MKKQAIAIIVQLVHIHGPLKGEIQEFPGNEIAIGRHSSCDLQFPRDLVVISRKHANITREGNQFKIIDHSTNGTFVNGERVTEAYLKNGDVLIFTEGGPKVSFLTRVGETMEKAAPDKRIQSSPKPHHSTSEMPHQPLPQPVPPPQPPLVSQPQSVPQPSPVHQSQSVPQPGIQVETVKAPLIIQYGPVLQSFNELPITIGTHADCDLTLDHPSLLERHIQVFFSQGSYRVKDLSGRNQVLINNQPIISPSALTPGDKLFLTTTGPAFHFMEGGRMAEINIPPQDEAKDIEDTPPRENSEKPLKKKKGSVFQKFFG
jgi:pSer/pThr/pTyr-binding forkhead associated (FHA) protein